ncbi:ABC transporter substrate-binding protein [Gordonia sp. HY002]|uniref:ABC transporter substrate-binding protein n=1 Tax=Gordonia zhenghanii TaxID=2911516 RepID=UPI001EF095BE|nr:ABC transporter substrate-binding protein [Gordonia zhenghanii]MCF8570166.1 ABC transporter substrate-binding protein [Gordonia zhenghanii]MCF8608135.1 ABC transporter substrate-binding protein [Gordonia zhenghanii]
MMKIRTTKTALTAVVAVAVLTVSACGGGGGGAQQSGQGIAENITIAAVNDQTGPVAYAGVGASKGAELAIEQINDQGFLGDGVTMSLEQVDTAGEIDRAVSEMTKTMGNGEVSAVLGPTMAQQAAAVAPLVGQRKVPTVFTQSGAEGVVVNDYTFRATAPMESYYDIAAKWLSENGHKDVSVIYNATYPTFANLGKTVFPKEAAAAGVKIGQSLEVQSTTQDFTGQAQQIAQANPPAVVMMLIASQAVTFMKQLRQAGYQGQIVGTSVQGSGNAASAGAAADGLVYPVDFSAAMDGDTSKEFTKAFTDKFGESPDTYAAEGFDAIWWIARGIKASNDSSRDGVQKGLAQVAGEGFTGAMGDLTFDGNDMRVTGAMVEWRGGEESLVN